MMKVIFYRVWYNRIMVSDRLGYYLSTKINMFPERNAKYAPKIERAKKKKLFACYCVNQQQIHQIKETLEELLGQGQAYVSSIGYEVLR